MTNPFYGSSLFQARKTDNVHPHSHSHSHLHHRNSANLVHARSHAEFHNRRDENETADLDPRDTITEVVQTVSVVQIIDGYGATLSVQTVTGSSRTDLVDSDTGSTIDVAFKAASATTTDSESASTLPVTSATATAVSSVDPVSASTSESGTSVISGLSLTHISPSLTSSPFSTLSSTSNSTTTTSSSFVSSFTPSLLPTPSTGTNATSSPFLSTATTPEQSLVSGDSSTNLVSSTTFASSILSSTTTASFSTFSDLSSTGSASSYGGATATDGAGGEGGSGSATASAGSSTSSGASSSGSASGGVPTQTSEVVGGVVGGIAGVALLVALVFMILKMKKRGWCHLKLSGDDNDGQVPPSRVLGPSEGDGGSGAYGTMQRTGPQSSVAASLAALTGKRNSRERSGSGPGMAERGFVRVSGRKLPPVLQYGGDGFTDPRNARDSHLTNASVYRDSMAVFDQPNHTPLALGSPMRPESGIMTVQPGPARTPVTTQAPPHIDSPTLPRSSTFPSTDNLGRTLTNEGFSRDAIGRTLAGFDHSRDGAASRDSRGSHNSRGSTRFTEHVS